MVKKPTVSSHFVDIIDHVKFKFAWLVLRPGGEQKYCAQDHGLPRLGQAHEGRGHQGQPGPGTLSS